MWTVQTRCHLCGHTKHWKVKENSVWSLKSLFKVSVIAYPAIHALFPLNLVFLISYLYVLANQSTNSFSGIAHVDAYKFASRCLIFSSDYLQDRNRYCFCVLYVFSLCTEYNLLFQEQVSLCPWHTKWFHGFRQCLQGNVFVSKSAASCGILLHLF